MTINSPKREDHRLSPSVEYSATCPLYFGSLGRVPVLECVFLLKHDVVWIEGPQIGPFNQVRKVLDLNFEGLKEVPD